MSLYDYRVSLEIAREDYPFYALIMTAMRQADDKNIEKLKMVFPDVFDELYARYHAPHGCITETEIKDMNESIRLMNIMKEEKERETNKDEY